MLSEQRVMHMTKMAMIEDKQGRKLGPAIHYRKRDYLSLCTLGGVFLGTLIYAALYAGLIVLAGQHFGSQYPSGRIDTWHFIGIGSLYIIYVLLSSYGAQTRSQAI